jgi:hypothetical protein
MPRRLYCNAITKAYLALCWGFIATRAEVLLRVSESSFRSFAMKSCWLPHEVCLFNNLGRRLVPAKEQPTHLPNSVESNSVEPRIREEVRTSEESCLFLREACANLYSTDRGSEHASEAYWAARSNLHCGKLTDNFRTLSELLRAIRRSEWKETARTRSDRAVCRKALARSGQEAGLGFSWLLAGPAERVRSADVPTPLSRRMQFDGKIMRTEERCRMRGAIFAP